MKNLKKLLALALIAMLVLSFSATAFAADESHVITISGAVNGETYTAYKLMDATYDLESGDTLAADTPIAYYYTGAATDELYTILADYFQFDPFVDDKAYLKVADDEGEAIDYTNVDVAALAAELNTAMTRESNPLVLTAAGSATASGTTASITVDAKGYYFVDTSLGSLCSIDTAATVTIIEKNSVPSLTKEVQEDSDSAWYTQGDHEDLEEGFASAERGEEVTFRLTVNTGTNEYWEDEPLPNGVDDVYLIVDELPDDMTYVAASAATTTTGVTVSATNAVYDADENTLTITLAAAEVAALGQDADIVITYKATLDEDAVVDTNYDNTATLTYKEQESESAARVVTYEFEILKVDAEETPLEGVVFTVTDESGEDIRYYDAETGLWTDEETELVTDEDGTILITGIDDGTYTVTEIETLPGYNKLTAPITVTVTHQGEVSGEGVADGVLTVVNQSGTVLPSTGGIGTTIFYIVGGLLVVGAAVVLIAKKRVSE